MMALLFESAALLVELTTKPLWLVALSCRFCFRSMSVVFQTWIELLRAAFYLHLNLLWRPAIWSIALLSLPVRAFSALCRERVIVRHLHQLRTELEDVLWERKELENRLRTAIKDRKVIEAMLMKLEDEYDEVIVKRKLLEQEVHDLKDEIRKIKEVESKLICDNEGRDNACRGNSTLTTPLPGNFILPDYVLERDMKDPVNTRPWPLQTDSTDHSEDCNILARQRELAVSHSLFSAILSLVVGMIIWEAKEPCIPLVVALFTVVVMSLSSVIKFFSTIHLKPASQAVALLSLNWFILGALTYPTLPILASVSIPLASTVLERAYKWSRS